MDKALTMADTEKKTLLICQGSNCDSNFTCEVDASMQGDAASLPAALRAHKAGWVVADGQILCPQCAARQHARPLH